MQDIQNRQHFWRVIFTVFLTGMGAETPLAGQDLWSVEQAVAGLRNSAENIQNYPAQHRSSRNCDPDDNFSGWLISEIFGPPILWTMTSPWWIPIAALDDQYSDEPQFSPYPYAADHRGYLILSPAALASDKWFGARLTSEYATNFSRLERVGGRLQLDTATRFGLDTEWNWWNEQTGTGSDQLWTGDANLVYRFAQSRRAQFFTGLGLNWISGNRGDVGFNFTYGFDLFPAEPLVLRNVIDVGTLGKAGLFHFKSTVGFNVKHVEIFTGYDSLRIGGTSLQGMIGGLSIWW